MNDGYKKAMSMEINTYSVDGLWDDVCGFLATAETKEEFDCLVNRYTEAFRTMLNKQRQYYK